MTPEIIRLLRLRGTRVIGSGNYMVSTGNVRQPNPAARPVASNAVYLFPTDEERRTWVAARVQEDPKFEFSIIGPEYAVVPRGVIERR
jgi:hypothetical protein